MVIYVSNTFLLVKYGHNEARKYDFFSRKRRRAAHHYIKKRKGQEPKQPHKHQTHARTHGPPVEEFIFAPGKTHKATKKTELNTLTNYRGGGQSGMIALEPLP